MENNEGVLSGGGGSDSSLPSQNRLHTYYLCPKHIPLVATVGPPAQELEDIKSLIGKRGHMIPLTSVCLQMLQIPAEGPSLTAAEKATREKHTNTMSHINTHI